MDDFATDISRHVWEAKYQHSDENVTERTIADTWRRIARAVAAAEPHDKETWERRFFDILKDFKFLPGGRIQAGAGTDRNVTLFNCFVMGTIDDSIPGIFQALQEGAVTMQQGGGIGLDFSTLRPRGARAKHAGNVASGPVSFMQVWDAMCGTILSTGVRRGLLIALSSFMTWRTIWALRAARPSGRTPVTGTVPSEELAGADAPHCCVLERESD
jgi:ribonucleoside-diphosphate reductase alpha chain